MIKMMQSAGLARSDDARALEGRVAVVTGSTSGIGLGVASTLAEAGAMIVLNGFGDPHEIETLCHVLGARYDVPVRYDDADMSRPDAILDMIERTGRAFGPVEILINNAGIQHVAPIEEIAGTVRFLCSAAAASITGVALPVDGGWTAH